MTSTGPLAGVRVLEFAGLGPVPHACMVLADLGAQVLRVDRPGAVPAAPPGPVDRGRTDVVLDLARPEGVAAALRLTEAVDVLVEGFRPGVMERLGLGPNACLARNPRLVYARMTGWGQDGPLAPRAGHDINYLGLTGALAAMGAPDRNPLPPLNLVGDYGGGSMLLLVGVLAALVERSASGEGQVVDAAMVDGVTSLLALTYGLLGAGLWQLERGVNLLDGGAPFYTTYACAGGGHVAVGALEPRFWEELLRVLGLDPEQLPPRHDETRWPELRARLAGVFATRSRDEWAELFGGVDACVTPVLTLAETAAHPQLGGRGTVTTSSGAPAPGVAPRFSRTPGAVPAAGDGVDPATTLIDWGLSAAEARAVLAASG
ncbi:MAG: CaiB/BaiF CoA transferase family protein [Kineosporiaceae bacterium]